MALLADERIKDGHAAFMQYHHMVNHPQKAVSCISMTHFRMGEIDQVNKCIERVKSRYECEKATGVDIDLAIIYAGIGDYETAYDLMERVYENRMSIACMGMIWLLRCPLLKEMHEHERYAPFMDRLGFD